MKKLDLDREQIRIWIEDELRTKSWVAEKLGIGLNTLHRRCKKWNLKTQRTGPRSGAAHPDWRGGVTIDKDGYRLIWVEAHPCRRKYNHYILEHRLVMEESIGRYLDPAEVVHHKNGNKLDNRLENLELFASNADHLRHELTGRVPKWTKDGKESLLRTARLRVGIPFGSKLNDLENK